MATGITIDFNANLARFTTAVEKATSDLNKFQTNATRMERNVSRAFSALSAAIPAGLFVNFIKGTIDAADNLNDLHQRTGIAIGVLAGLKAEAEKSGSSVEELANGMKFLANRIEEAKGGNEELARLLDELGVTGENLQDDFFKVADAFEASADGQGKMALATELFSRSGEKLIPLLNQGGTELRRLTEEGSNYSKTMTELAPKADELNDQIVDLRNNATAAGGQFAQVLVPSLNDTAKEVNALMAGDHGLLALVRALAGIGKLPFDVIFGDIKVASSAAERIKELRTELKHLEDVKERGKKSILGAIFGTPQELDQQITVIKNQIIALEKFGDQIYKKREATPPPKPKVDTNVVARISCETDGGLWDGQRCHKRPKTKTASKGAAVTDPLGINALVSSTSIEKIRRIDAQIAELTRRFEVGKIGPQVYQEAVAGLTLELDRLTKAGDVLGTGSFFSSDSDTVNMIQDQQEAINDLNSEIAETTRMLDALGSGSYMTSDSGTVDFIREQQDAINDLNSDIATSLEKNKSIAEELGITFTSAFEDAIVSGKSFRDVLSGIADDILRLLVRKSVTEPLLGAIGSLFPSAKGNVFASPGLSAYSGQIVSSPTIFPFASGGVPNLGLMGEADPEAILPLKRGTDGKLGVQAAGNVVVNVNNNAAGTQSTVNDRTEGSTRIIDIVIEQVKSAMSSDILRGGTTVSNSIERTYGLSRTPGAY